MLVDVDDVVEVEVDVVVATHALHVPGHSTLRMSPTMSSSQSAGSIAWHLLWSKRPLQIAVVAVDVPVVVPVDDSLVVPVLVPVLVAVLVTLVV